VDGRNNFPKLHNAMWPGLVGKGPDSEPPIGLDEMLHLTAAAEVDGIKFEGVDLFLADPHTGIARDRARADGGLHTSEGRYVGSTGATGFALTAPLHRRRAWLDIATRRTPSRPGYPALLCRRTSCQHRWLVLSLCGYPLGRALLDQ